MFYGNFLKMWPRQLIILIILHFCSIGWGNAPLIFQSGRFDLDWNTRYFYTQANHDSKGNKYTQLGNKKYFENTTSQLYGRWGFNESLVGFGSLSASYSRSETATTNFSTSGLSDGQLGVGYLFAHRYVLAAVEASAAFPFETVGFDTNDPLIGEGSTNFDLKLYCGKSFQSLLLYGYLGATARNEGRSTLMPWGIGIRSKLQYWIFEGLLYGFDSVADDEFTDNAARRSAVTDRVNAGSLYFFAVNPSLIQWEGSVGYKFSSSVHGLVGYGSTITGASSASGYSLLASLRIVLGESKEHRLHRLREKREQEKSKKRLEDFNTDDTDLELFEPSDKEAAPPK